MLGGPTLWEVCRIHADLILKDLGMEWHDLDS